MVSLRGVMTSRRSVVVPVYILVLCAAVSAWDGLSHTWDGLSWQCRGASNDNTQEHCASDSVLDEGPSLLGESVGFGCYYRSPSATSGSCSTTWKRDSYGELNHGSHLSKEACASRKPAYDLDLTNWCGSSSQDTVMRLSGPPDNDLCNPAKCDDFNCLAPNGGGLPMLHCGDDIDKTFADGDKMPSDLLWSRFQDSHNAPIAGSTAVVPALKVFNTPGQQAKLVPHKAVSKHFCSGDTCDAAAISKSVFTWFIQGPDPVACTGAACAYGTADVGYVSEKPGIIHNGHYDDSFTLIFKRIVCLKNAYMPAKFHDTGTRGEKCFSFKQSRCFTCLDDAYKFDSDINHSETDEDSFIKIMKCPTVMKCPDNTRGSYYRFQLGAF